MNAPKSPGDQTRPPLFTPDEWRAVVRALKLSKRQAEVVGLAIQSRCNDEIAAVLGIGKPTARRHLEHALTRLGVTDRVAMAYRVFETFRQECNGKP